MHTAEAAAAPAAAPTAAPAAPGTFWQFFSKCSDPSSSDPSSLFQNQCGLQSNGQSINITNLVGIWHNSTFPVGPLADGGVRFRGGGGCGKN